ncbi:hypothetical protein I7I53_10006 [Histoplasma capsulatum var. duboisii H88]|uniref:Uncharacterized protein n=3 Tax=Ajellomyces capsulatus TaxID=5037 RepID=A0A8A1LAZ1_AJEC8|nr:hypothetical protein I7I53_10006 [Histoplasma capsulatum var. duboisii H88]
MVQGSYVKNMDIINRHPPKTRRHSAAFESLKPSWKSKAKENAGMVKGNKQSRKMPILALLGKLSRSVSSSRSQSPISPPPYSSSTPPCPDSTTAPRLSNPLSPPTSTSVSINLKPAEYVRRIKLLLASSKKIPPSPLPTSSHPPCNDISHNIPNSNGIKTSPVCVLQHQDKIPPTAPINTLTPRQYDPDNLHDDTIHPSHNDIHDTTNPSNNKNTNTRQSPPRSASPLLPPNVQPSSLYDPSFTDKETRFLKTFLRNSPPRSITPLTQFNIATLQAELDGRSGPTGRGGVRDVSKPNPLGVDGGDDYDELLELGRSARAAGQLEREQEQSREKLVSWVQRWLGGIEPGSPVKV